MEWCIGSVLNDEIDTVDYRFYDYYFNVTDGKEHFYFGVDCQGRAKNNSYFYQIKGKEDGSFDYSFIEQDAYSPALSYYQDSEDYQVYYTKKKMDEEGNELMILYQLTYDADGNQKQ